MESSEIIKSMDSILSASMNVIKYRKYSLGVTSVYYVGGTLTIDLFSKARLSHILMVNISTETVTIYNAINDETQFRLLSIPALKLAFEIYKQSKGKTPYYYECLEKSCVRHLTKTC